MEGGRRQHRTEGQSAVVDLDMQLVTDPGLFITLGALLRPHITVHRQLRQGLRGGLAAPASRLICPTSSGFTHCSTKAWRTFSPSPIATNAAKAREKADSEGTSPRLTKPQRRRKTGEAFKAAIVAQVAGWLYTALPTKARARAWRSQGFRPNCCVGRPANLSIWSTSKMLTNCCSFSVNRRSQPSSRPGIKFRCKVLINHDTASLSFIGSPKAAVFLSKLTLAQERR